MLIYFIRHCPPHQIPGVHARDWPLNPLVTSQETAIQTQLDGICFDKIFTSTEPKAIETAQRLFADDREGRADARLDELGRGPFIADYETQVEAVFNQPAQSIKGWEAAADCVARALDLISEQQAAQTPSLALCGHGLQGALLRAKSLGQDVAKLCDWRLINLPDLMILSLTGRDTLHLTQDFTALAAPH